MVLGGDQKHSRSQVRTEELAAIESDSDTLSVRALAEPVNQVGGDNAPRNDSCVMISPYTLRGHNFHYLGLCINKSDAEVCSQFIY